MPAIPLKTNAYMKLVIIGFKKSHAGPKIVCLYDTVKERFVNSQIMLRTDMYMTLF